MSELNTGISLEQIFFNLSIAIFEGSIAGTIGTARGSHGFGWDVIFQPEGFSQSFAEMTSEKKHKLSMRGIAAQKLKCFLA